MQKRVLVGNGASRSLTAFMSRRAFSRTALAALLGPAFAQWGGGVAHGQGTGAAIDVHCHVFNASDLPIEGFLRRVVFEDYSEQLEAGFGLPGPLAGLIAALVGFLDVGVITAEEELAALKSPDAGFSEPFDPFSQEAVQDLADALETVLAGNAGADAMQDPSVSDDAEAFRIALEFELSMQAPASPESGGFLGFFEEMATQVFRSGGLIGLTFRWAAFLRGSRLSIVEELQRLYAPRGEVCLFAPALIDFSAWLEDEPASSPASQIAVMEEVQSQASQRLGVLLHSFAPFDPWRQAMHARDPESPLNLAKAAVEQQGFLGVKLYPPMGFLPAKNEQSGGTLPIFAPEGLAGKIDAALEQLYEWAVAEQVPLLAHASNGNGSGPDYASRANPANWRPVLEKHPGMHICLAHFGEFLVDADHQVWEDNVGRLMADYENVFVDLSYLHSLIGNENGRAATVEGLQKFLAGNPRSAHRLVYGSDWIMLGREPGHQSYLSSFERCLRDAGFSTGEIDRVRRDNAIDFFGLSRGQRSRERIDAWRRTRGLNDLRQFD